MSDKPNQYKKPNFSYSDDEKEQISDTGFSVRGIDHHTLLYKEKERSITLYFDIFQAGTLIEIKPKEDFWETPNGKVALTSIDIEKLQLDLTAAYEFEGEEVEFHIVGKGYFRSEKN
jgi:hypothetical protein